jgi:carboxyl-terminal processing protease
MTKKTFVSSFCLSLFTLTLTQGLQANPIALEQSVVRLASTATATAVEPAGVASLAAEGRFDELLTSLRSMAGAGSPKIMRLVSDLQNYSDLQAKAAEVKSAEFKNLLVKLNRHLDADDVEAAITDGIATRDVAPSLADFMQGPEVTRITEKSRVLVNQSIDSGDWIEALAVLRGLEGLFDDRSAFRNQLQQVNRHVRVLRLYAPAELEKLVAARRDRLSKKAAVEAAAANAPKDATPVKMSDREKRATAELTMDKDKETWTEKLSGVDLGILRSAISQAARTHVAGKGILPLMRGAYDGLLVLLDTRGLESTFSRFKDQKALAELRAYVVATRKSFDNPETDFKYSDAVATFDRLVAVNDRTLKLPEAVLANEMGGAAFDSLDEFTAVIWPRETESFNRNFTGKLFGVGVLIMSKDDRIVVISPVQNSPAMKAGIRAGDTIATVGGRDTADWNLDRAIREITGPEGTQVTLGIERGGNKDLRDFKLTRAEIPLEPIKGWQRKDKGWDYMIDPANRIGYVRMSQFIPQTASDLDKAINEMEAKAPLAGLIIDLRFNPGGLLTSAIDVVDRFVAEGPIVSTAGPDAGRNAKYTATGNAGHRNLPLVVLVNRGSASASEIVSGALQDYKRAVIVGDRSFGKGSVQDVYPIDNNRAYFKVTTQYYKLPSGRIIHRQPDSTTWGIEPDVHVSMTAKELEFSLDARQDLDVLHAPGEAVVAPHGITTADQLISKGIDRQLQAALLILQARLATDSVAAAK